MWTIVDLDVLYYISFLFIHLWVLRLPIVILYCGFVSLIGLKYTQ